MGSSRIRLTLANWLDKFICLYIRLIYRRIPVKLSSGRWVKVRRLGLYELDRVPFEDPGPFEYEYKLGNGQTVKRPYDISQWSSPPKPPTIPEAECLPGSMEQGLWQVYHTYEAAYAQRLKQVQAAEDYGHQISLYIVHNCLSLADQAKLKEPEDYLEVQRVALNLEITLQEVEAALASSFPGYMARPAHS